MFSLTVFNFVMYLAWKVMIGSDLLTNFLKDSLGLLQAIGGSGVDVENFAASFLALGWRQPILIAIFIGYVLTRGSRSVAADIEEETTDFIYTLPISRFLILVTDFLSTLAGLTAMTAVLVFSGIFFGNVFDLQIEAGKYFMTGVATVAMYAAFTSIVYLLSALTKKTGITFLLSAFIIFILYLIDLVGNLFEGASSLQSITLFSQYRVAEFLGGISGAGGDIFTWILISVVLLALTALRVITSDL